MLLTVSKVLGEVFNAVSPLAGGFLSITASLGDCLVEMANAVNNSKTFKTTLDGIHWIIGKVSEGMQTFAGVLTDVSNNVSVVFDPLKTPVSYTHLDVYKRQVPAHRADAGRVMAWQRN